MVKSLHSKKSLSFGFSFIEYIILDRWPHFLLCMAILQASYISNK